MKLQTQIPLNPQERKIDYHSKTLLLGSCFVENIGEKLSYFKFQNLQNPFGILFHPIAIEKLITRAINDKLFQKEDLYFSNNLWFCFEVHSTIYASSEKELLEILNSKLIELKSYVTEASHIIITFGTSWVYRFIETQKIVANCNKISQKKFQKELLSIDKIKKSIQNILSIISNVNSNASILFTVSPVRHIKDGFVENTRSKSHLISAIHSELDSSKNTSYFPSYEIMMDELRDYRFYKEDMIHPNKTAVSIIWEAFQEVCITNEGIALLKKIEKIQSRLQHKALRPDSKEHQLFKEKLKADITLIEKENPKISF